MDSDATGQAILKPLAFTGFMATKDADYEIVRSTGYKLPGF
jgi:hypothetical protein